MTCRISWTLVTICVALGAVGQSSAQPGVSACKLNAERCHAGIPSPLCIELQQRCGRTPGGTASAPLSRLGKVPNIPRPVDPMDMPQCAGDEEIVLVPTCQCELDPGDAATNNEACAGCTSDGVRMECQKTH
jgi:hypothetical protein